MSKPLQRTVKRLFALSNNQCAFPQCSRLMVQPNGTVTGEICHIAARNKSGPRFNPNLSVEEKRSFPNLILLCEEHHTIVDKDTDTFTTEWLHDAKATHENNNSEALTPEDIRLAKLLHKSYQSIRATHKAKVMINSPGGIQADKITIITEGKRLTRLPHPEAIGSDLNRKNYIKYLIDRYNRFQHADKEKLGRGKYITIYNAIKTKFGTKWDEIPLVYFDKLTAYLHTRILKSKLGRIRNAHRQKSFSYYEEWLNKPEKS